jgi:hypothetical protein
MTYTGHTTHTAHATYAPTPTVDAPVVVSYQMTRAELRAAALSITFRRPRLYIGPAAGLLFLLWGLLVRFGSGPDPSFGDLPIFFGLIDLSVLPLVALVIVLRIPAVHAKTAPQAFAFWHWGVQVRGQHGESHVAWSAYRSIEERGQFFVLHPLHGRTPTHLPKRAFASPDDIARFRNLLALHAAGRLG